MSDKRNEPDELKETPSLNTRVITALERVLGLSALLGRNGFLVSTVLLSGYLVMGGLLSLAGVGLSPEMFFSPSSNPPLVVGVAIIAVFIVQATASLILYYFLTGVETTRAQFVIFVSFIGLGSGGAVLRFVGGPALEIIASMIGLMISSLLYLASSIVL